MVHLLTCKISGLSIVFPKNSINGHLELGQIRKQAPGAIIEHQLEIVYELLPFQKALISLIPISETLVLCEKAQNYWTTRSRNLKIQIVL
jgi:hypothetical protein